MSGNITIETLDKRLSYLYHQQEFIQRDIDKYEKMKNEILNPVINEISAEVKRIIYNNQVTVLIDLDSENILSKEDLLKQVYDYSLRKVLIKGYKDTPVFNSLLKELSKDDNYDLYIEVDDILKFKKNCSVYTSLVFNLDLEEGEDYIKNNVININENKPYINELNILANIDTLDKLDFFINIMKEIDIAHISYPLLSFVFDVSKGYTTEIKEVFIKKCLEFLDFMYNTKNSIFEIEIKFI